MWYAVYEVATGKLVSSTTVLPDPLPGGLASAEAGETRPTRVVWNEQTHQYDPQPATRVRTVSPTVFLNRMGFSVVKAVRLAAKQSDDLDTWLWKFERHQGLLDLDDPELVQGLQVLKVALPGILTDAVIAACLADGEAPPALPGLLGL